MVIRGELSFEGGVVSLGGAAVYVRLIDVSHADAAARTVAEYKILLLPAGADTSHKLTFELASDRVSKGRSYTLAAHVDLDGDGKMTIGDYITMESFPVSGENLSSYYVLRVRRITQ